MDRQLLITSIILLTLTGCSTLGKIETGGEWIGYNYSYFCPAYSFSAKGQKSKKWDIVYTNHISMAGQDYLDALKIAEDYIKNRGGKNYYDNVKFVYVDITYLDSADNFKNKGPLYDLDKCGDTKYYFSFLFSGGQNIKYRFGIALNDKNEIISEHIFPNQLTNPDFDKIISPSKAIRLAKNHNGTLVTPLETIELVYNKDNNCFVWDLEQEMKLPKSSRKVDYGFMTLNAKTGQIIDSGKRTGQVHIHPSF